MSIAYHMIPKGFSISTSQAIIPFKAFYNNIQYTTKRYAHKKHKPNKPAGGCHGGGRVNVHSSLRRVLLSQETRKDIVREELKAKWDKKILENQVPRDSPTTNLFSVNPDNINQLAYSKNAVDARAFLNKLNPEVDTKINSKAKEINDKKERKMLARSEAGNQSIENTKNSQKSINISSVKDGSISESSTNITVEKPSKVTEDLPWFVTDTMSGSAKRIWPVAQMIKGLPLDEALIQMKLCLRNPAKTIGFTLEKSIKYIRKFGITQPSDYQIATVCVNNGTIRKEIKYHAKGRFGIMRRRSSYVRIKLEPRPTVKLGIDNRKKAEEHVFLMEQLAKKKLNKSLRKPMVRRWNDTRGWKYITRKNWTKSA